MESVWLQGRDTPRLPHDGRCSVAAGLELTRNRAMGNSGYPCPEFPSLSTWDRCGTEAEQVAGEEV